jgi:hypothetical protein
VSKAFNSMQYILPREVRTACEYLEPDIRMPQQQFRKPNLCSIIFPVTFPHTKTLFNLISICLNVVQRCSKVFNVYIFWSMTHCKFQSLFAAKFLLPQPMLWLINIDWSKPMDQANENCIKQDINDMSNICNVRIPSLCS